MTAKIVFGLFGASGFGREVMPLARETVRSRFDKHLSDVELVFVETSPSKTTLNDFRILSEEDFIGLGSKEKYFNIAIANSKTRERLANKCEANGVAPLSLRDTNVVIYDHNEIGKGSILCAYSTITSNAKIGKYFHSNIYSYVAHECVLGDFVTFAPRVNCNGNVHIGNHAYIGTSAVIKQGEHGSPLIIGEGAIVGMGAVVTKNVPPRTTVIGNPARPMSEK